MAKLSRSGPGKKHFSTSAYLPEERLVKFVWFICTVFIWFSNKRFLSSMGWKNSMSIREWPPHCSVQLTSSLPGCVLPHLAHLGSVWSDSWLPAWNGHRQTDAFRHGVRIVEWIFHLLPDWDSVMGTRAATVSLIWDDATRRAVAEVLLLDCGWWCLDVASMMTLGLFEKIK